jgi:hypothetical protein
MPRLDVDPTQLDAVARLLAEAGSLLSSVAVARPVGGGFCDDRADAAFDRFRHRWGHGVRELGAATATAGQMVAQAARAYGGVESELMRAFAGTTP